MQCNCVSPLQCLHVDGSCYCPLGYHGAGCEVKCPNDTYGRNCTLGWVVGLCLSSKKTGVSKCFREVKITFGGLDILYDSLVLTKLAFKFSNIWSKKPKNNKNGGGDLNKFREVSKCPKNKLPPPAVDFLYNFITNTPILQLQMYKRWSVCCRREMRLSAGLLRGRMRTGLSGRLVW